MNLLEFKLFALKKRNHNFVFEYVDKIANWHINLKDLQVVVKDDLVRVGGTDIATLADAYTATLKVVSYRPMTSRLPIDLQSQLTGRMSAPSVYKLEANDLMRADLMSKLTAGPVLVTPAKFGGVSTKSYDIPALLAHIATTQHLWANINSITLDASGGLSVAKQTLLVDLASFTLEELDCLYDTVLTDGTSLHNLNYFVY